MIVLLMLIIQTKDEPSLHETNCIQYYNTKFTNRWKEFESQGHPFHVLRDLSVGFGKNCCNSHATGSDVTSIFFHLPFVYHYQKKNFHLQQQRNGNAADCRLTHKNQGRHIEEVKITNNFICFGRRQFKVEQ